MGKKKQKELGTKALYEVYADGELAATTEKRKSLKAVIAEVREEYDENTVVVVVTYDRVGQEVM